MKLYEYNRRFAEYLENAAFDEETGELIPPDFAMEKGEAIDSYIAWYKNSASMLKALKEEMSTMSQRAHNLEKTMEFITDQLTIATEGQKYESAKGKISYRKSSRLVIDDEKSMIENGWYRTKMEPDKTAVKQALKSGERFGFAHLEENRNIQIK